MLLVAVGNWADLVLIDPSTVLDIATYEDPKRESVGIDRVWVNGQLAFDTGRHTQVGAGRVLHYQQH